MLWQGFYYDAFYGDLGLNDDHFKKIESGAMKAATVFLILLSKIWCILIYIHFIFVSVVNIYGTVAPALDEQKYFSLFYSWYSYNISEEIC